MTQPVTDGVEALTLERLERVERMLAKSADSYEAPSGKIMYRVWVTDLATVAKLARQAVARPQPEGVEELVERAIRDKLMCSETTARSAAEAALEALAAIKARPD
jgi:hypothetical protein